MRVSFSGEPDLENLQDAAPWTKHLPPEDLLTLLLDQHAIITFESQEVMQIAYDSTVGDEGPTATNPYEGPLRVYALTCDPLGKLLTENT